MPVFTITVTQTSTCSVDVEANTYEEALELVEKDFRVNRSAYEFENDDPTFE